MFRGFLLLWIAPFILGFSGDRTILTPRVNWDTTCKCGQKPEARIVNGETATSGEYPWMVALCYSPTSTTECQQQICGGTLINDRYILTAAHCLDGFTASDIVVTLREHDLSNPSETQEIYRAASSLIMHSNYDDSTYENDIGLIKLTSPVPISDSLLPVCLPPSSPQYNNVKATITGWGLTTEGGKSSMILREAEIDVYSLSYCQSSTGYESTEIKSSMICAGTISPRVDSCQGDSGGPLIFKDGGGNYDQIGVVSFGYGCARANYPGVYTRVGDYLDWIKSKTTDGVYCSGMKL